MKKNEMRFLRRKIISDQLQYNQFNCSTISEFVAVIRMLEDAYYGQELKAYA